MLGLKLNHVSKRGHRQQVITATNFEQDLFHHDIIKSLNGQIFMADWIHKSHFNGNQATTLGNSLLG